MRISGKFAIFGAAALLSLLLSGTGVYDRAAALHRERVEAGRMKNVVLLTPDRPQPTASPTATEPPEEEPVAELRHTSVADRIHPANSDQKIQEP